MKKVMQTKFGSPDGNCLPACIATVTGIDIDDLPNFCKKYKYDWLEQMAEWLLIMGWATFYFSLSNKRRRKDGKINTDWHFLVPQDTLYLVSGKSPRGKFLHSCVYRNGELFHDPHSESKGLKSEPVDFLFFVRISHLERAKI